MDRRAVCGHWIGGEARYCLTADRVGRYLTGLRCPGTPRPPSSADPKRRHNHRSTARP